MLMLFSHFNNISVIKYSQDALKLWKFPKTDLLQILELFSKISLIFFNLPLLSAFVLCFRIRRTTYWTVDDQKEISSINSELLKMSE